MAKNQKYDEEGLIRLAAGILQQARSDYILGKILMIRKLRKVVDLNDWSHNYRHKLGPETQKKIDRYFDVTNFIDTDPYGIVDMLGGSKMIYKNWDNEVRDAVDSGKNVTKGTYASAYTNNY